MFSIHSFNSQPSMLDYVVRRYMVCLEKQPIRCILGSDLHAYRGHEIVDQV